MTEGNPFLAVIVGPTASGKSDVAINVAKKLNGEIVSADSMQVYSEMKIGTARPSTSEMQGIPHHLMGFLPLDKKYSVSDYAHDARAVLKDVWGRRQIPILCGGTGLYIDAIVDNLQFVDKKSDEDFREEMQKKAKKLGNQALLDDLMKIDVESGTALHPSNLGRIIRALEIYHVSGITMTEQKKMSKAVAPSFNSAIVQLDFRDRAVLYDRINSRVELMIKHGLLQEVREIFETGFQSTSAQAIGYKELLPYISGEISFEKAVENLKQSTRRYAKRQLTWFRKRTDKTVIFVDEYDSSDEISAAVFNIFERLCHCG